MTETRKYSELKEERINLREAIPLEKPFTVLFEPASSCNFKCSCCFHSDPDFYTHRSKGVMSFSDFKKIADDLRDWPGDKVKVIRFIGFGEPLLNSETPEMISYAKKLQIAERLEMTTNASLLNPELSDKLINSGIDYIRCSIYSVNPERHRKLTSNPVSIDKIRDNIEKLKQLRDSKGTEKPFIYVKMLESPDNSENELFLKRFAPVADEVKLEKLHDWLSGDIEKQKNTRQVCPQPFKMLSLLYNGDVILCDPDWQKNTCVGNAVSETISSIWKGEKIQEFWKMQLENRRHENKSCKNCTFLVDEYAIDNLDGVSPTVLDKDPSE